MKSRQGAEAAREDGTQKSKEMLIHSRSSMFSRRFAAWFHGEDDPFLETMPMREQKEHQISEAEKKEYEEEKQKLKERVYDLSHNRMIKLFRRAYRILGVILCALMVYVLFIAVSYLPPTGNPHNPANNEVPRVYLSKGIEDTGSVNAVTGMILSYRAFDTFGETNVLFIAGCCVMILLMLDRRSAQSSIMMNDRFYEPKNDAILQQVARILVPIIFLFAIYVMLNGHLSPGGGFSGGAMMGAGMILYVCAFGFDRAGRFFNERVYTAVKVTALMLYGVMITYYYIMGANGLDNHIPLGKPGAILSAGLILPINLVVGLQVACTMYAFYVLFRRGAF